MLFSWSAAPLKVVMDSGTVCSLSERFSAVTVMASSSVDDAAVSAAKRRIGPINAATPAMTRWFLDILIGIPHAKSDIFSTPRLFAV
jgi:hypothetical protein